MEKVRRAKNSDLDFMRIALFELNKMHHEAVPDRFKTPEEIDTSKNLTHYIRKETYFAFVAEADGSLVGFIAGNVSERVSSITKSMVMGTIDELFVSESHRGLSVGSKLIQEFENECKRRGASEISVEIWEFNEKARAFYKAHGLSTWVRCASKKL